MLAAKMNGNFQQIDNSYVGVLGSINTTVGNGVSVRFESIKKRELKISECSSFVAKGNARVHRKTQYRRSNDVVVTSVDCPSSVDIPNGMHKTKFVDRGRWVKGKSNGAGKFNMELKISSEGRKKQPNSPGKWASYGGCIPLMLRALETVKDLDIALKPWKDRLSNKERSIILKEQTSWERALEIFEWFKIKGCYELNVIHYNIMLRILGKSRKWDQVERLWKEMKTMRIIPTNSTYGTLIDVYSKGGLRKESLLWLEKMNQQGIEPDEVTMGIVVQTYKKAGEFEKAKQFFKDWSSGRRFNVESVTTSTKKNATSQPQLCLSSYTYNTLIDTYGKAGQLQEASATFSQMLKEGIIPNTVTFNTMIHMCGNHGQIEEVPSLMQKMEELRCPPDTRTYNILISLHIKHNNINAAMSYFAKVKQVGLKPDLVSYRTLLYALSIRHMVGEVEALVTEMDELELEIDEFTQSALTRMYIDAGMLQRAWSWFERFHLTGQMSLQCYSANIDAYGERGYLLEAEKAFSCCQEKNKLTVLEYNVMIKAYGIGKNYIKACDLFDSMEKNGVLPDACSYSSLIQMLSGADLPHVAKPYIRKMQDARLACECIPYCAVISSFVKLGKLEMAEKVFEEMVGFGVQPDIVVFGVLINAFADVGSVEAAMRYVELMRNSGLPGNPVIYKSLIKLYTKVGFLREAQDTYKLIQSAEASPEVYSSNCMLDLYGRHAMVGEAEEIFEEMRRVGVANEFSYAMMLCMYRKVGRLEEALVVTHQMRELGLITDLLSFNNIMGIYASHGRLKEAVETFREMINLSIRPDEYTFKSLGVVLVKCGVSKEAISKLETTRRKDAFNGLRAWMKALFWFIDVEDSQSSCGKAGHQFELDPSIGSLMHYEIG